MSMNKFLIFTALLLASCGTNRAIKTSQNATSNPTDVQASYLYSTSLYGSDDGGPHANVAVLLPMSGPVKSVGNDIKTSVETAFLHKPKHNIRVSFYDLSGDENRRDAVIDEALKNNPDIIIGPLFAEDTVALRDAKSSSTPVISFTSDAFILIWTFIGFISSYSSYSFKYTTSSLFAFIIPKRSFKLRLLQNDFAISMSCSKS